MSITYPTTIDTFTTIPPGTTQDVAVGGRQHLDMHNDADSAVIALETKVGVGAALQTPTGGAHLTGLTDGSSQWLPSYDFRNKVRNGRFQIAERTATQTDNSYTLDGWRILLEAANAATLVQDTADVPSGAKYAGKMVVGSGNNNKFGIFQVFEGKEIYDLRGDVASFQVKLKATSGITNVRAAIVVWTGTEDATTADPVTTWGADGTNPTLSGSWAFVGTPANLSVTTSWATYKVTENAAISGSATNVAVMIWCDDKTTTQTTDILRIADVQVERGKVCTAIEVVPHPLERQRCLWFHEEIIGTAFEALAPGQAYATTTAHHPLSFSRKRAAPSITFSATADFVVTNAAYTGLGCTAIAASQINVTSAQIDTTVASGLVAGNATNLVAAGTGTTRILIDKEL